MTRVKVLIASYSDLAGGAAIAAYRLNEALSQRNDVDSEMVVSYKVSENNKVFEVSNGLEKLTRRIKNFVSNLIVRMIPDDNGMRTVSLFGSALYRYIINSNASVVNVHWVNWESLSIFQVSRLNKKIILTLHDMWWLCGTEHYCSVTENSPFISGYNSSNAHIIDRVVWSLKRRLLNHNIIVVTPSNWLSQCAMNSKLFRGHKVLTIANAIDTTVFRPMSKKEARANLGLPTKRILVGFGAVGGRHDPRKGFDLLVQALNKLGIIVECVILGEETDDTQNFIGDTKLHFIGKTDVTSTIVDFYNSIDVMVVPSRQEAFGQTASEAISCGVPVSCFKTSG